MARDPPHSRFSLTNGQHRQWFARCRVDAHRCTHGQGRRTANTSPKKCYTLHSRRRRGWRVSYLRLDHADTPPTLHVVLREECTSTSNSSFSSRTLPQILRRDARHALTKPPNNDHGWNVPKSWGRRSLVSPTFLSPCSFLFVAKGACVWLWHTG